jgi:hypothetical protein
MGLRTQLRNSHFYALEKTLRQPIFDDTGDEPDN